MSNEKKYGRGKHPNSQKNLVAPFEKGNNTAIGAGRPYSKKNPKVRKVALDILGDLIDDQIGAKLGDIENIDVDNSFIPSSWEDIIKIMILRGFVLPDKTGQPGDIAWARLLFEYRLGKPPKEVKIEHTNKTKAITDALQKTMEQLNTIQVVDIDAEVVD